MCIWRIEQSHEAVAKHEQGVETMTDVKIKSIKCPKLVEDFTPLFIAYAEADEAREKAYSDLKTFVMRRKPVKMALFAATRYAEHAGAPEKKTAEHRAVMKALTDSIVKSGLRRWKNPDSARKFFQRLRDDIAESKGWKDTESAKNDSEDSQNNGVESDVEEKGESKTAIIKDCLSTILAFSQELQSEGMTAKRAKAIGAAIEKRINEIYQTM